jgi:uncharacterized membrane protein
MSKLSEAKILGGVGALLMLFGGLFLPGVGAIIGLILVFISVKYISNECKDSSIFDNYLLSFIYIIVAIVAMVAIFLISIGSLTFFSVIESMEFTDFNSFWDFFVPYIAWWIIALLVGWIFMIFSAMYLRKSYNTIAEKTKVELFKTTGFVNFLGAILLIVGIGIIIIFVAKILEIISYFRLPDKLPSK